MTATSRRMRTLLVTVFLCTSLAHSPVLPAPDAELWERWTASDEASATSVDHSSWSSFLGQHITQADGINLLRYAEVTQTDRAKLRAYIDSLAATPVSQLSRSEQLPFWINLYNALTVETILAEYPVESIRDISDGLFSSGPWDREAVTVESETLTLNDIEHRILRPIWKDPRIHYAVNCASIGCPNLAAEAYTAENAEELLERAAAAFINHPRGARVDNGRLEVSSIYVWFGADFGANDEEIIAHLRDHAADGLAKSLAGVTQISGDSYNWSLNEPGP